MSPVKSPSGIAPSFAARSRRRRLICEHPRAFVVTAVDVQDPGNVGALIRALRRRRNGPFVCGASASPFSWKASAAAWAAPCACHRRRHDNRCRDDVHGRSGRANGGSGPARGESPDEIDWRGQTGLLIGSEGPD
jgi:tRNA G18 (ribose-2'-O)-methylase SpoU